MSDPVEPTGTVHLRRFQARDADALSRICLLTGIAGQDATGHFSHDMVLGDIYAVPYAVRDPRWSWVIASDTEVFGYLVATPDTNGFEDWFWSSWWPERDGAYRAGANEATLERIDSLSNRRADAAVFADEFPAHLHINLLSSLRGGGWGRALIETLIAQLRAEGISGVHLVASLENANAQQFYERLGFERLEREGAAAFGMRL